MLESAPTISTLFLCEQSRWFLEQQVPAECATRCFSPKKWNRRPYWRFSVSPSQSNRDRKTALNIFSIRLNSNAVWTNKITFESTWFFAYLRLSFQISAVTVMISKKPYLVMSYHYNRSKKIRWFNFRSRFGRIWRSIREFFRRRHAIVIRMWPMTPFTRNRGRTFSNSVWLPTKKDKSRWENFTGSLFPKDRKGARVNYCGNRSANKLSAFSARRYLTAGNEIWTPRRLIKTNYF